MAMSLAYTGEFLGQLRDASGALTPALWTCEVHTDFLSVPNSKRGLAFPADEPLVIEWCETSKEDVICGSSATLTVVSPSDRHFIDLYTCVPGSVRLDVLLGGSLYWRGYLDPEFYEEPYDRASDYEVRLVFSDFGLLQRKVWDRSTGMFTIFENLVHCLDRCGLGGLGLSLNVSSTLQGVSGFLGQVSVRSDNFYDEDGAGAPLSEVVTGMLQPFGLRMVQRLGTIWVYDLNALCDIPARPVRWSSTGQTLSIDKTFSSVEVTFSPYAETSICAPGDLVYPEKYDLAHVHFSEGAGGSASGYGHYFSYYPELSPAWSGSLYASFTIFTSEEETEAAVLGPGCRFFHILPNFGGASECSGVAAGFVGGIHALASYGGSSVVAQSGHISSGFGSIYGVPSGFQPVLTTRRRYVPPIGSGGDGCYIRVVQEILVDCRYNPFEDASDKNCAAAQETMVKSGKLVFIPAMVQILDDGGYPLMHYENRAVAESSASGYSLGHACGSWEYGPASFGDCWLEYYDPDLNLSKTGPMGGWVANRQCIGRPDGWYGRGLLENTSWIGSVPKIPDGEYIPMPTVGGWLEVSIGCGVVAHGCFALEDSIQGLTDSGNVWERDGIYRTLRWQLYKLPTVEVVSKDFLRPRMDVPDIVHSGTVNPSAREVLELDTVCGTASGVSALGRGALFHDGTPLGEIARGGVTDVAEKLLIGTLHSQYASRRVVLSGEVDLDPAGLCRYEDAATSGVGLMMMADVQDLMAGTSEVRLCEVAPDEYTAE